MLKTMVVYESKWGTSAELAAKSIVDGIREIPEMEAFPVDVKGLEPNSIAGFDAVLVGVIDGCFAPTGTTKKLIDGLGKTGTPQSAAVFDTYMKKEYGTLRKTEKRIADKAPGLRIVTPGLSIKVDGINGPISEGELPRCKEFGRKFAALIKCC